MLPVFGGFVYNYCLQVIDGDGVGSCPFLAVVWGVLDPVCLF